MEGKTVLFVVLSGLCFLPACFPHLYILVEKAKTWSEAQSYCRETYTDLASADNEEDLNKMVVAGQRYYNGHLWIGLYDDINSWRWSLEDESYYGEGEAEFRVWMDKQPNNYKSIQHCVLMTAAGVWNDIPCTDARAFVCYNGSEAVVASSSFIFVNELRTWSNAQSYCREHYTDLASVRNQAENDQIQNIIGKQLAWIGLYRETWKWSDGNPSSFRKWGTGEPNGDVTTPCVLLHEGQWEDANCDTKLYFICHIVPAKQRLIDLKVTKKDSTVNLEDAAEAILQQFSQTLMDRGLSEDMKLTWRKQSDGKVFHLEEKEETRENKEISCNPT